MDLKKRSLDGADIQLMSAKDVLINNDGVSGPKKPIVPLIIPTTLNLFNLKKESPNLQNAATVLKFLNEVRGIKSDILMRYGVGMAVEKFMGESVWEDQLCVTFPWMKAKESDSKLALEEEPPMEIIRVKYRSFCEIVALCHVHLNRDDLTCCVKLPVCDIYDNILADVHSFYC